MYVHEACVPLVVKALVQYVVALQVGAPPLVAVAAPVEHTKR